MARFYIKSKKTDREFRFWMNGESGYIYLEDPDKGKIGQLGDQICKGGEFTGNTLSADSVESFEKQCRNWYISYMRKLD